jgi:hypothetical protein
MTAMVWLVAALLVATMASGAWCAADVGRGHAQLTWPTAAALAVVAAVGIALRYLLVPPHHAMYLDEPWYAEAACHLARGGRPELCVQTWAGPQCADYGKALGWPIAIAPWAWLGGCATTIGIELNRLLGSATVLLVALAARGAGCGWWQAIAVAAILAVHPTHVGWSATGETNIAAAAALLAGTCGALRYLRRGRTAGAALAVAGLALATAVRPESLLAVLAAALVVGVGADAAPRSRLTVAALIAGAGLAAALSALPLWSMNTSISGGAFLALGNLPAALAQLAGGPAVRVHGVVLALAVAGAIGLARRQAAAAALLLGTGLAVALAVLAYDRFDQRMLLAATVVLLPLGAAAFESAGRYRTVVAAAAVIAVALLWLDGLRGLARPAETQWLETRAAERAAAVSLSADALIVAAQPTVLGAGGRLAMPAGEALGDGERLAGMVAAGQPVYFFCDMFCEPGFAGGAGRDACAALFARFTLTPVVEEALHGRTYGLYRLGLLEEGAAPPACPRGAR